MSTAPVSAQDAPNTAALVGADQGAPPSRVSSSAAATLPFAKAINAALHDAMKADETVIVSGEDVGQLGGVFRVTQGLIDEFGEERVRDTPLAEASIVGTAIGMAMGGYRPVVEIQFDGFVFPAFNQITTQLARLRSRSAGTVQVPVVIRIPYGGGIGAVEHHGESPEAYFMHTPGLRVVAPADPQDAYTLLRAAIESPDPVIFLEPKARYWAKGEVARTAPTNVGTLQEARVERAGSDVTLIGYGATVATLLEVAEEHAELGVDCGVVNLRSLSPLDMEPVVREVCTSGRAVIAHEAPLAVGPGAEVAARLTEACFYHLEAPVARVAGPHIPYPAAAVEADYLPTPARISAAIEQVLAH